MFIPKSTQEEEIPNCSEIGVLGVLPGIIGSLQANEVIKIILNLGKILSGKVLYYNSLNHQSNLIKVSRSEKEIQKVIDLAGIFENLDEGIRCKVKNNNITLKEALTKKNIQWIDVRNDTDQIINYPEIIQIPFEYLEQNLHKIDKNKEQVVFCHAGIMSKKAVSILQKHQIEDSFSLKNGAFEVMDYFKNK